MKADALSRLHDFYRPPPPSWTPQTVGWYFVFGLLVLLAVWIAWRIFARWRRNRYRREALQELEHADISAIPVLLKRTALAAWPRERVASLSGEPWLQFLEIHDKTFSKDKGRRILDLEYRSAPPGPEEERDIRQTAADWIRSHRVRV